MNQESRLVDGSAHGRSIMTPARISNDNYQRTVNVLEFVARRRAAKLDGPSGLIHTSLQRGVLRAIELG